MMERVADEEQSLTGSLFAKKPRGYGAAIVSGSSPTHRVPKHMLSHHVTADDTLQSLAIKYDSSIADIKKANKLWNNESLSIRTEVLIPVYNDSVNGNREVKVPISTEKQPHLVTQKEKGVFHEHTSPSDFFARYDSKLSSIRQNVSKILNNQSSLLSDIDTENDKSDLWLYKRPDSDVPSILNPPVRTLSKEKIDKLHKKQDELFPI